MNSFSAEEFFNLEVADIYIVVNKNDYKKEVIDRLKKATNKQLDRAKKVYNTNYYLDQHNKDITLEILISYLYFVCCV